MASGSSTRPLTGASQSIVYPTYIGRPMLTQRPTLQPTIDKHVTEPRSQVMQPSNTTPSDFSEISGLRKLLHVASELKQIDLGSSLKAYKEFMKQTKQDDISDLEEKILESRREQLEELNSGTLTMRVEVLMKENEKLQEEKLLLEKENNKQKEDLKNKEEELRKAKSEKEAVLMDKNEALTRLSKEMGTKLSDNNPTIADLSDPNRAMKLGERYSELYDGAWTDALEILCDNGCHDEEAIKVLLDVLKRCHQICAELSEKQMTSLQMTLVNPALQGVPKPAWGDTTNPMMIDKSIYKHLKECRKRVSAKAAENVVKECATKHFVHRAEKIPDFVKQCLELCWLMSVQDPPVVLGKEATVGVSFDANMYKQYTNSGTVVLYNVWPPLLLHENGPLLIKGVVQPVKTEKKKNNKNQIGASAMGMTERSKTYGPTSGRHLMTAFEGISLEEPKKQEISHTKDDGWAGQFLQDRGTTQCFDHQVLDERTVPRSQVNTYTQQTASVSYSNPTSTINYAQQSETNRYNLHPTRISYPNQTSTNNVQQPVSPSESTRYPIRSINGKVCVWYERKWHEINDFKTRFNITSNNVFYYV